MECCWKISFQIRCNQILFQIRCNEFLFRIRCSKIVSRLCHSVQRWEDQKVLARSLPSYRINPVCLYGTVNKNDDQGRNNRLFLQPVIFRLAGNPSQTTQSKDIILIVMMQIVMTSIDDRDADNCHCSMFSCSVFLVNVCYNTIRDKQPWFRHKK